MKHTISVAPYTQATTQATAQATTQATAQATPQATAQATTQATMNEAIVLLEKALVLIEQKQNTGKELGKELGKESGKESLQQAKWAIAHSPKFQHLLISHVPEPWHHVAQQRLLKQLYRCPNPHKLTDWIEQSLVKIVQSLEIDEALCKLIQQIQSLPRRSSQRRNLIPVLITQIQSSGKITTCIPNLPIELYQDALHETLLWFCEHLDDYDPTRAGPVTWFNRNLFYTASKIKRSHYRNLPQKFQTSEENKHKQGGPDAYDPLIAEAEHQIIEDLYHWVSQDKTGRLKLTALRDRLDINAQALIKAVLEHIRRLSQLSRAPAPLYDMLTDQPIEQATDLTQFFAQLATRWQCSPAQLSRFWREKCRPYIENFLQQSGNS